MCQESEVNKYMEVDTTTYFKKYMITAHACERFAERMMNRDNATDIRAFINEHKADIEDRINKLICYGDLIYVGDIKGHSKNEYYYKDEWVVITDPKDRKVITLYKLDLGDDEVTSLFASKTLGRIKEEQAALQAITSNANEQKSAYQETIASNEREIAFYKQTIKHLEETNDGLKTLVKNVNTEVEKQNKKIEDLVTLLVQGRKF